MNQAKMIPKENEFVLIFSKKFAFGQGGRFLRIM